jgi:ABC-2 type transport system permease protein
MIGVVCELTLRQLLGRGRMIGIGLLALLPVGLAVAYRLGSEDDDRQRWVGEVLLEGLVTTTLLPLVALVVGTAVLGAEIDDGTAVHLLSKPVRRSRIVLGKLLAAWLVTTVTVVLSALVSGWIGLGGVAGEGLLPGFAVALTFGALAYCALFLMLSLVTSRALIVGLVYVLVWEGLVNGFLSGTRLLSIRHYTLAIADAFVDLPRAVFSAPLGLGSGVVMGVLVTLGATWYAVRRLRRFEIGDTT